MCWRSAMRLWAIALFPCVVSATPQWVPGPAIRSVAKEGTVMTYDARRRVVVLFGGDHSADTWEFDGVTWRQGPEAPSAMVHRIGHRMAFDTSRARTVLVAGLSDAPGYSLMDDVWEYDGTAWTAGPPIPGGRCYHGMAFDAARSCSVVFGGFVRGGQCCDYLADTWEFDGLSWTPGATPPPNLTPRGDGAMAYDPQRARSVHFGGRDESGLLAETWEYDGVAWSVGPMAPPGLAPRMSTAMVHDSGRGSIVLFGGMIVEHPSSRIVMDDTWLLGPSGWIQLSTDLAPAPRSGHTMAYDPVRDRTVVFGFDRLSNEQDTATWELAGSQWSWAAPPVPVVRHGNPPREAIAFDENRQALVVSTRDSLWEYDGLSWRPGVPAPTDASQYTSQHFLAFDRQRRVLELYALPDGEMWEHDGAAWKAAPAPPYGRDPELVNLVYDGRRGLSVLRHGDSVHEFDGATWVAGLQAPTIFGDRRLVGSEYSSDLGAVIFDGGSVLFCSSSSADIWTYDGSSWRMIAYGPQGIEGQQLILDTWRDVIVRAGGWEAYAGPPPFCERGNDITSDFVAPGWVPRATGPGVLGRMGFDHRTAGALWLHPSPSSYYDPPGTTSLYLCRTVSPSTLPDPLLGVPYSQTFQSTGSSVAFDVAAGALPTGLSLGTSGVLSGTPTGSGVFSFRIRAVDPSGCAGSELYELTVCGGAPSIDPPILPDATERLRYGQSFLAACGTEPYSFRIAGGMLPPGLTLFSNGIVAGTPSAQGVYAFDVSVSDAVSTTATRSYVLTVDPLPVMANVVAGEGLGPSNPNRVRVATSEGLPTPVDFHAYAAGTWGVIVGAADVDGGLLDEILTGPGPGPVHGPKVNAFRNDASPLSKVNFYAYGTLKGGVAIAGSDVDGDGFGEILTSPGPREVFGPHLRAWNFDGVVLAPIAKVSFFAFSTLRFGAQVGAGDVDADGFGELLAGPGPGAAFGASVRGFDYDGTQVVSMGKINFWAFSGFGYGVVVSAADVDGDGFGEIATSPGPGPSSPSLFAGYDYDGASIRALPGYTVDPFGELYGGRVALGDVDGDSRADLLAGAGPDPTAKGLLLGYTYDGSALERLGIRWAAFASRYGVVPAAATLAY